MEEPVVRKGFLLLWLLVLVPRKESAGGGQQLGKIEENTMHKENVI